MDELIVQIIAAVVGGGTGGGAIVLVVWRLLNARIEADKIQRLNASQAASNQHDQHMTLMNLIRDDNQLRRQALEANSANTIAMRQSLERLSDTLDALAIATQNMTQVVASTARIVGETHKTATEIAQTTSETQVQLTAVSIKQDAGLVDIGQMITSAVADIKQALIDINNSNEKASRSRHDETLRKVDRALLKLDKIIEYTKPPEPPLKAVQPNFKPAKPAADDESEEKSA